MNEHSPALLRAYVALAVTVAVWGIAPAFVRSFSTTVGPWDSIFIRLTSVAVMCLPFLPFCGIHVARKDWGQLLLVSWVGMFGYFLGSIYGFAYVKTGVGGIIIAVQPLIIALMASVIGTEKLTVAALIGLGVSFLGVLFLFGGDMEGWREPGAVFGASMLFLCNVAFAINVVYSRSLVQTYGATRITILTMILTAVPALFFFRPETLGVIGSLGRFEWWSLFFLGFIGTIAVVILWNQAVGLLRPVTVGASLYVIPFLAVISGWLVLNESLSLQSLVAGVIIVAGVAISEFGPRQSAVKA
jgi:drug/metabolite transporter (DMT)-like permease